MNLIDGCFFFGNILFCFRVTISSPVSVYSACGMFGVIPCLRNRFCCCDHIATGCHNSLWSLTPAVMAICIYVRIPCDNRYNTHMCLCTVCILHTVGLSFSHRTYSRPVVSANIDTRTYVVVWVRVYMLQIQDTLGQPLLPFVRRLSSLGG